MSLRGKTIFITGASRGIGLAIALRAARDGARIAIAAKTAKPHPKLPGTIFTAAKSVEKAGGQALALEVDVRHEAEIAAAVDRTVREFGGIDICVNNASAIKLSGTEATSSKYFDLMHAVNTRGTYLVTKVCLPHLKRSENPHVLMLSPPLELRADWIGPHVGYTIAKYGMSLCVLGMAEEFREAGVAFNALWPRTLIATAAIEFEVGDVELMRRSRKPEIVAEAAYAIFNKRATSYTGNFEIDDQVLSQDGMRNFDHFRVDPKMPLALDLFIDPGASLPEGVSLAASEF